MPLPAHARARARSRARRSMGAEYTDVAAHESLRAGPARGRPPHGVALRAPHGEGGAPRRTSRERAPVLALAVALPLVVACSNPDAPGDAGVDAAADAGGHVLAVDHVDDLGAFSAPGTVVGRDGTTSGLIGGELVWTFGDTFLTKPNAQDGTSVRSSTAGWSTPASPLALTEPLDDAGLPMEFIPYTPAEVAQNQADAGNGFALWPGSVIPTSATEGVVLFNHVVRSGGSGFAVDAVGTAHVTKDSTQATRDPSFLFQPPDPLFGVGGATVDGDTVYLFDCEQALGFDYHCKIAKAPVAGATTRAAYTFWSGAGWVADVTQAAWFIDRASYGISIQRNPWLGKWLAVYSKPLSDDVALRTADAITGPWTDPEVVVSGSAFVTGDAGTNYLAKEHGALRSVDGKQIVVGYAHPLPNFGGACRLARITLK